MAREVGIGIAGYGMMGKAHSYAYTVAPVMRTLPCRPRLRAISGRDEAKVARAAAAYGFEHWVSDWRELVNRPDVDIVDICTPPGTHAAGCLLRAGDRRDVVGPARGCVERGRLQLQAASRRFADETHDR